MKTMFKSRATMQRTTKVAILDDHVVTLEGLQAIISREDNIELVAAARSWDIFWSQIRHKEVDILILDIHLTRNDGSGEEEEDGIEIAEYLRDHKPGCKTILMTFDTAYEQVVRARDAGIEGYLLKEETSRELIKAIQTLSTSNQFYYSRIVMDILVKGDQEKRNTPSFTRREGEVLSYIARGHNVPQIVSLTGWKESTIRTHKKNVMKKLGIKNVEALVAWAIAHNFHKN
jgi:DNA-binding NarL/FixJ family response regulator